MESIRASALPLLPRPVSARGFSLVEMMVVLAIISIVTSVTLLGHSSFDRSLLITDAAYTTALAARQMQTYGLASRSYQGSSGDIDYGYGMSISVSAASPTTSYVLFADTASGATAAYCPQGTAGTPEEKTGNCVYDAGSDGIVQTYALTRGFRVSNICGKDTGGTRRCSSDGYLTKLDVVFRRPETEAIINAVRAVPSGSIIRLTTAEIYLTTNDATASRAVCISSIGQISVSSSSCP